MKNPVQDGYFASIQQGMVARKFALMARVQINNKERPYHVPADFARSTNLFFHQPQKSILLHLEFMEHAFPGKELKVYWRITLYVQFLPYRKILESLPEPAKDEEAELWGHIPIVGTGTLHHPFFRHHTTYGYDKNDLLSGIKIGVQLEQNGDHVYQLPTSILLDTVTDITEPFRPHVGDGKFSRLQVADFAPTYTFSGTNDHGNQAEVERTERLFWDRFDWQYARHFLLNPWGACVFNPRDRINRRLESVAVH